jgi:hypothetical protein
MDWKTKFAGEVLFNQIVLNIEDTYKLISFMNIKKKWKNPDFQGIYGNYIYSIVSISLSW